MLHPPHFPNTEPHFPCIIDSSQNCFISLSYNPMNKSFIKTPFAGKPWLSILDYPVPFPFFDHLVPFPTRVYLSPLLSLHTLKNFPPVGSPVNCSPPTPIFPTHSPLSTTALLCFSSLISPNLYTLSSLTSFATYWFPTSPYLLYIIIFSTSIILPNFFFLFFLSKPNLISPYPNQNWLYSPLDPYIWLPLLAHLLIAWFPSAPSSS